MSSGHLGERYIGPRDGAVCGGIIRASPAGWECDVSRIIVQGMGVCSDTPTPVTR